MASGKRVARRLGAWICFADESGISLRPARTRTWARRGNTPIVTVAGRGGRKLSLAGIVAYRADHRPRIIYRTMLHRGRKGEPKGFREDHFADLLDDAHQQLHGPIVLLWDGLPAHKSAKMRALITARPRLRVYRLPSYAPELNPVENMWSSLKRSMANLAAGSIDDLLRIAKNRLKRMQYRPTLAYGFLATSGLAPP
ncbi:putative transposase [Actinoplanes capillaceus]|uniref:Transposase n=1 Tax=Actinoplanes campanulatus TaxID=113559 RepID=A0ABQ3WUL9_9ACTN|nr:IS630 family transposase [Actinoplanes capillaceus]GID49878.1 putative transposase [Actinoplanes capillaceus]